ncbi:MAG: hypothetical protein VYD25_03485 [Pseudomonadota bacterium]|nr:hypothetical protein [Pseudomonadota bacterium]MEE3287054.1 hypothetical protein [Pseudomonadota bacterium]
MSDEEDYCLQPSLGKWIISDSPCLSELDRAPLNGTDCLSSSYWSNYIPEWHRGESCMVGSINRTIEQNGAVASFLSRMDEIELGAYTDMIEEQMGGIQHGGI